MALDWAQWTSQTVEELDSQHLLRAHRTLLVGSSSVKARITEETFQAWISDDTSSPFTSTGQNLNSKNDGSRNNHEGFRDLTLFSTNDYLGLSSHPDVKAAAAECAKECGLGPRSSALVGGFTEKHRDLEVALADLKGTEECILFPTGYAANIAVLTSLGGNGGVAIFSDELNHASIVDGCRLATKSGAQVHIYRHNNMRHLERLLAKSPVDRKLVITDSLFSMDGDFADLKKLASLKKKYNFLLAADEAHATLVCGVNGGGACEEERVANDVDVHVGTLSKAAGSLGGFVCCTARMRQLLASVGRTHIFSTALPLPVVSAALESIKVSRREWWRRVHLWKLAEYFGRELGIAVSSPIIPLIVGSESDTMDFARNLLHAGFHVAAIRPPTVPAGTSRLRISLSAAHSFEDVSKLVEAIKNSNHPFISLEELAKPTSKL
ncbi:hypothetical protein BSKO_11239 [Bryopsis sp. KO-2023]|nr:hypothetical protein BSKO_11239 [Bryopsis sp. KO-2023]